MQKRLIWMRSAPEPSPPSSATWPARAGPVAESSGIVGFGVVPVLAPSEKQEAIAAWNKAFGLTRSHIATVQLALAQLPSACGREAVVDMPHRGTRFLDTPSLAGESDT
ncbi:hypothetical protein EJ357_42300 [Streptomyces cyaneochromogenes]|uniref:Uncharacterized protein n=1 Tax=Streptomyces cyaneochromogenes TaxID=2496836 RepID=A0A3S9MJB0_9ACTN|nr:hypothetical protein [Streptomyces cyaneochromogenes]AZQ39257.1 hypothetical protein EJ357_42300 [Streptomyces cyaneochromogenes]